ncbi:bifunctional aspartate transaminase/aspartate 4-decarboxylase [Furfurilactobacillus entadae]|uniref:bifunctional aspartate transaminase/aspartate 4-decarboxylase n=1 Tax=Furfurilactobacillus entadae TaxID=2922307 RepID=UPI0035EB0286
MTREDERALEQLGAFEISDRLIDYAKRDQRGHVFLNAGRGNPNWINVSARSALINLMRFGLNESQRTMNTGNLAGYIQPEGIAERLQAFCATLSTADGHFLSESLTYVKEHVTTDLDAVVAEWVDGVIGNNYPVPPRVLRYTEPIITQYLAATMGFDETVTATNLFPTEGGTAAIVDIFHTLRENGLIAPGDKIAINTPIFTPYLEIPTLDDYQLVEVDLRSTEAQNWEIQPSEVDKLKDDQVKLLILVNPSNPGAMALNEAALAALQAVVAARPQLMIITDDVYGTFVPNFKSVYSVVPQNTVLVYSYSKLFGATGWRLGVIAVAHENVFDALISQLPVEQTQRLRKRYGRVVTQPDTLSFIERLVADSRSVGLYDTAGLSTPQQILMVLFSLTHLLAGSPDSYIDEATQLVVTREHDLNQALGIPNNDSPDNTHYYELVDIYRLAEKRYGKQFRDYLMTNFEEVDFLKQLAEKRGVVLMDGVGFGSSAGILRVSQANLPNADYAQIGTQILAVLADYYAAFSAQA